jgi:transposase
MKRPIHLEPHLNPTQIKERLYHSKNGHHASYWQIILSVSLNPRKPASEYCSALGISSTKFYRIVSLYNQKGAGFCEAFNWGGRRERRCVMSFEEEEQFLESQVQTALQGGVLVAGQLREAVEQKVGHPVSDDYLFDLLHRHGWSKKAPRPEHPKAEEVKVQREGFKKKPPPSFFPNLQKQSP